MFIIKVSAKAVVTSWLGWNCGIPSQIGAFMWLWVEGQGLSFSARGLSRELLESPLIQHLPSQSEWHKEQDGSECSLIFDWVFDRENLRHRIMFFSFRKDLSLLLERSWVKGTSNPRSFIQSGMDTIRNVSPCEDAYISSSLLLLGYGPLVSQLIAWGAYPAGLELQALSPQTLETGRIPAQFSVSQLCFQNYRCLMGHSSQTLGYIRIN